VLLWAADFRYIAAVSTGDIHEVDRCIEIIGSMAEQLDQPTLNWLNTFIPAARAMIAGDTDQAELLARKALQMGTDGGHGSMFESACAQHLTLGERGAQEAKRPRSAAHSGQEARRAEHGAAGATGKRRGHAARGGGRGE
jgi:hypothetical protein